MNGYTELIERIIGRKAVRHFQADGLDLALETIREFTDRSFSIKGSGVKHRNIPAEEIIRFIDEELPPYYSYTTKIKRFIDKAQIQHARISIKGTMSLNPELTRYNPLDRAFVIKTEKPQ